MSKENVFVDAESYGGESKEDFNFRFIILTHLKRISEFSSVEFRGGYWNIKRTPVVQGGGGTTIINETYVPDSREVYSNAVECFADMLYPHFDEEMRAEEAKIMQVIEEAQKAYKDKQRKYSDKNELTQSVLDELRVDYRHSRLKANRLLFRALCAFLYRKKYLELGTLED